MCVCVCVSVSVSQRVQGVVGENATNVGYWLCVCVSEWCLLAQNACSILRREQVYKYVRFFINASVICVRVCVCV